MVKTYCLKERKLTENINPKIIKTENGRKMIILIIVIIVVLESLGLLNHSFNWILIT